MGKKNQPNFSIVIAAFNEEKRLPNLLQSIKQQSFKGKIEVIVVDNNSTDQTAKIACQWGARVLKEKRQGTGPTKNKGCLAAKGRYLAIFDADVVIPNWWLEKAYQHLNNSQIALTGGPYLYQNLPRFLWPINKFLYLNLLKIFKNIPGGNMAFRKTDFQKVGGIPADLFSGEDIYLSFRLSRLGKVLPDHRLAVIESGRKMNLRGLKAGNFSYFKQFLKFLITKNPEELKKIKMEKID
jgi:glycosyltransferase involved in cell wall biosynthesis